MAAVRQQIFRAEWNALQRPAETLALELFVHRLGLADGLLRERQGQGVVARAQCFQARGERAGELDGGDFPRPQLGIQLGEGGEEQIVADWRHDALRL